MTSDDSRPPVSIIGTVEGCSNEKETRKALAEIAKFREQK